ncbi:MAG TPA: type I glutamate--ammonia ligase [Anaerolineaceae bacterium]|jgi:glutamine synthetase|nr:type I glutamate--ammonia ligase [Chloroflexota bacterium]HNS07751.1 type I glutamate--ammonia ligase [Anaerolineaceae bacterium]HNW14543.1 type I glutamate--ammonia ligase [Anaerolineaceae bacterium]HOE03054.1 type I glutamate--ammonia ligase [Anaerolineaceae bacterium]HOQ69891.1 type I glutamate--ammonia ligase [Anaerolineaceae bacterium]
MDKKELLERVAEDRVRFISFQFSDVSGTVKSVDAPISRLEGAVNQGIWFDGSSVEGFARIQESDMRLKPDIDTYAVLPWSPENMRRARLFCNIYNPDGTPFAGDPRGNLSRQLAALEERGMRLMVGSEPEFFLFRRNGSSDIHPVPHDVGGYFDFSPNDEAVRVRTELMQALDSMGLEVEVGHHECALGQHEIDFHFSNALRSADNVLTLKYTVKAIAAQNGLIASFMPKPIFGINGSGMHCHQSLFDLRGNNLFYDAADEYHLSPLAYGFIAGQLAHARAFSAVTAPTVNSYKRLVPGYEAPVYVGWAQTNRSALIRIPRPLEGMTTSVRAELRCPDPSCNPYLAYSSMLAAALDGMKQQLTPPEPLNDVNVYELSREERQNLNIVELPGSLREALVELEKDSVIQQALGETLYNAFRRAKWAEWERYRLDVTDWELARYLETA